MRSSPVQSAHQKHTSSIAVILKFDEWWWLEKMCFNTFRIDNISRWWHRKMILTDRFHLKSLIFSVECSLSWLWSKLFFSILIWSPEENIKWYLFYIYMKRLKILQDTIRFWRSTNCLTLIIFHDRYPPFHDRCTPICLYNILFLILMLVESHLEAIQLSIFLISRSDLQYLRSHWIQIISYLLEVKV